MRDVTVQTITEAVLAQLATTKDPRTRAVSTALVRHLHAFVREVAPTQAEWTTAIDFLTRTGQMCTDTRQEFILLSDTLGVSMLVDAINHPHSDATDTTVLGPFFVEAAPESLDGADISNGMPGAPLLVETSIALSDGTPAAGATVDIWHADAEGFYDVQRPAGLGELAGRARFRADAEGRIRFRSVVPSSYPVPDDGPVGDMLRAQGRHPYRPAHVHFMIAHPAAETLVTHLFLAGDPYLDSDAVFGVKDSLVVALQQDGATAALRHHFTLAPA